MDRKSIAVKIGGREYRILSEADEKSLQQVAGSVDDAMATIREKTGTIDSLDLAVLTALNFARELVTYKTGKSSREGVAIVDRKRLQRLIEVAEGFEPAADGGEARATGS